MTSITFELPDNAFSAMHTNPKEFAKEMRIAAAIKWYELEQISRVKAAEIAGLTPDEFAQALSRYQVSSVKTTETDRIREQSQAALARIRSRPRVNPLEAGLPDSTTLIREDRDR